MSCSQMEVGMINTRSEFLKTLWSMYPQTFTEKNAEIWKRAYEKTIPENIDFDKLFLLLSKEYNSVAIPPHPSWFIGRVDGCIKKEKCEALRQIQLWKTQESIHPSESKEFVEFGKKLRDLAYKKKMDKMKYIHD